MNISTTRHRASVLFAALFVGLGMSGVAQAAPGYCNTAFGGSGIQTDGLAVSDVTFDVGGTIYTADDCYGIVSTGPSDIPTNLTYVNGLAWVNFVNGVKDNIGNDDGVNSVIVDNIMYTLTTMANGGSGTNTTQAWTLAWEDKNGAALPNLPATVDFAVLWNGGNKDVFYLFDDVVLPLSPTSGDGLVTIKVQNNANNDTGTSHMDVFFTNATTNGGGGPGGSVPEPATIALMGLGLVGLATFRRRNKQQ